MECHGELRAKVRLDAVVGAAGNLRVGLVGCGMVAQLAHMRSINELPGIELSAIADLNPSLLSGVGARFNVEARCASHKEMLDRASVDAVVVVTHRHATSGVVSDCLLAGKHVLSEKPMAMTLPVARELVAQARRKGVVYGVGFMKRYDAGVARAKSLLGEMRASGRLGRLIYVRGKNFCAEYVGNSGDYVRADPPASAQPAATDPAAPEWLDPSLARRYDWLANVGLHSINLLRYLVGDLSVRHADCAYDCAASVGFDAGGVPVVLDFGKAATGRWEESLEFFFERGRLELQLTSLKQRDRCAAVTLDENAGEARTSHWGHDTPQPWCFTRQMQAFADAVGGRQNALLAAGEDSLKDMELLEDIFKCAQGIKNG